MKVIGELSLVLMGLFLIGSGLFIVLRLHSSSLTPAIMTLGGALIVLVPVVLRKVWR